MARRSNRKKRRAVPVPVASMGDIAFLLIIFFLVCSEVAKQNSNIQVTLPLSEYVEKMENSVVARVAVDEDGLIYVDGQLVDGPKDVESRLEAMLVNTVTDDERHVQFKCDEAITKDIYAPVLQAIANAGGMIDGIGEKEQ